MQVVRECAIKLRNLKGTVRASIDEMFCLLIVRVRVFGVWCDRRDEKVMMVSLYDREKVG